MKRGTHVVVDGERGILRAAHFAVLVALSEAISARCVPELGGLCEQLRRVLVVDKQHVVDTAFVQQRELVQCMGELGSRVFRAALEPFNALFGAFAQAELPVKLCDAETVHGAGVQRGGGLAEELQRFGGLAAAAPAVLAAGAGAVRGVGVAVLGGEDEEWVGAIKVLFGLDGADAVGVAVREEVLRGRVAAVCEALEQRGGLADELVAFFLGALYLHYVARGLDGDGEGL